MKVDFKDTQEAFVSYIRDPFNNPRPADVKRQRMETYRELFFNNIEGFLSSNFPVLKTILNDQQWIELAQDFFLNHACSTPHFSEIAEEFIEFLQQQRNNPNDYPFLLELAHYEWVEMALSIAQEEITANDTGFLQHLDQQNITVSELAWPLVYQYPVQQISPDFLPDSAPEQPTYLLVYRDIADEVNFIQIPPITFRLLQILQQKEATSCQQCLELITRESGHPEPSVIINSGLQVLQDLAEKNIIIPHPDA